MAGRREVDITPDKSLIKKLGRVGYRTEQAIAELIDNSIDARLGGTTERVDVMLDFEERKIRITDNGHGMDLNGLKDALTVARGTKEDGKLGRFGIGLKSACSSLGKTFVLTTARPESDMVFTATYDEDQWLGDKSKGWSNFGIEETVNDSRWHGTSITISNLKVPLYPNQVTKFKRRFGIRYGPHLAGRHVRLRVNSGYCKAARPEMEKGSRQKISIRLPSGNHITGWVGLLEKRSIKGDYGVHLYRRGRLIRPFDKFGIRHHPEVARIIGEVTLDHVPVNFYKTRFLEDTPEYNEAVSGFRKDPTVVNLMRRQRMPEMDESWLRTAFESDPQATSETAAYARLSAANARAMLRKAKNFKVQRDTEETDVEFEDVMDGVYSTDSSKGATKITINRRSDLFMAFKNPLFLLGLIRIEAEMVAGDPSRYSDFVAERNKRWSAFANAHLQSPGQKRNRPGEVVPLPNYSLAPELVALHDRLSENFAHDFQFTGMSMLSSFLHNAYSKAIYNIHTVNGAGQELLEEVSGHAKGFEVLLAPRPPEARTALMISRMNRFIVIREYADRLPTTLAPPEKAWLDAYSEGRKNSTGMYDDEIAQILEELLRSGLADPDRLRRQARRRKIMGKVEPLLGGR